MRCCKLVKCEGKFPELAGWRYRAIALLRHCASRLSVSGVGSLGRVPVSHPSRTETETRLYRTKTGKQVLRREARVLTSGGSCG